MASRRKLPIGIQTLRTIREEGYYYVDKSAYVVKLAAEGQYYFLSRPRRFGKSLFLDTIKELFEGNRALFQGLYADTHWDWSVQHPVIRISFADGVLRTREMLEQKIGEILQLAGRSHEVMRTSNETTISGRFLALIMAVTEKAGRKAVVLIDEYDKPILDNIEKPEVALAMREGLRDFYSVIKGADPYLRFVFLTGVSKFSKVSLFSGLNNLNDITLDPEYSSLCGYTEEDIHTVFGPELEGLDREKVRLWYNGYNWLGEAVYNPFDLLLLFQKREFRAWWYETGTPGFLLKLLRQRPVFVPELNHIVASGQLLSTFEVEQIPLESLMFQAGYLTIGRRLSKGHQTLYQLTYPNLEVYQSFHDSLLLDWTGGYSTQGTAQARLYDLLEAHDWEGMGRLLSGFFESIPHQWHTNNPIADYEGYYASVFYAFFASLGLKIAVEESSNAGRLDMVLHFGGSVLIFEFKLVAQDATAGTNSALEAIRERGYAQRYLAENVPVTGIGIEFSRSKRAIVAWDTEIFRHGNSS